MRPAAVAAALALALSWSAPVAASETVSRGQADGPRPAEAHQPAHTGQGGLASWFVAPESTAAAGPALRAFLGPGYIGRMVRVCTPERCVVVRLVTSCLCVVGHSERLIDLSRISFSALADPTRGLVRVEVSVP